MNNTDEWGLRFQMDRAASMAELAWPGPFGRWVARELRAAKDPGMWLGQAPFFRQVTAHLMEIVGKEEA